MMIIDNGQEDQPVSFNRFFNKTWDNAEAENDDDGLHLDTPDLLLEMFIVDNRDEVEFDKFKEASKCSGLFKRKLFIVWWWYKKFSF